MKDLELTKKGNLSEEELDKLEKENGELTCVSVDEYEFWFKTPDNTVMTMANKALFDKDMVKYNNIIINNSILNGLDVVNASQSIRNALHKHIDSIISDRNVQVKKRLKKA